MGTLKKIQLKELVGTKEEWAEIAEEYVKARVIAIRAGRVIKKRYKKSTIRSRRRAGLQTKFIDLAGSFAYTKKRWRLLDEFKVVPSTSVRAFVEIKRNSAIKQYRHLERLFGDIL